MPARLTVIRGREIDQIHKIEDGQTATLGRSVKSDVRVPDGKASRSHCRIEHTDAGWIITDMDSRNGTFVNSERITQAPLKSGDTVRIGGTAYKFSIGGEPDADALGGTEMLINEESSSLRPPDEEELRSAFAEADELLESPSEPADEAQAERTVCVQCGRLLGPGALDDGEASEIGGRLYCSRCVIPHGDDEPGVEPEAEAEPKASSDSSEIKGLLKSLEKATAADQLGGEPRAAVEEPEAPEPTPKPGLLDRLRRKKSKE